MSLTASVIVSAGQVVQATCGCRLDGVHKRAWRAVVDLDRPVHALVERRLGLQEHDQPEVDGARRVRAVGVGVEGDLRRGLERDASACRPRRWRSPDLKVAEPVPDVLDEAGCRVKVPSGSVRDAPSHLLLGKIEERGRRTP